MIESELSVWDYAALVVIVTEAGGRMTQVDGWPPVTAGACSPRTAWCTTRCSPALYG